MTKITRQNIDQLLDAGKIQIRMATGRWWTIRRNGATKRWIKNPERIRIPVKFGFKLYDTITETEFNDNGILYDQFYRVKEEEEKTSNIVAFKQG